MKKLFGEYLVEKNIVDSEALLQGLLTQVSTLPALSQVVHDLKLLESEKILRAMSYQTLHGVDFRTSCQKLDIWTDEIEGSVLNALKSQRVPIGQILVDQGAVDSKALVQALDDFLAESGAHEEPSSESSTPVVPPSPEPILPIDSSSASNGAGEPQLRDLEKALTQDYQILFDEDLKKKIDDPIAAIVSGATSENLPSELEQIFQAVHTVRGTAVFLGAELTLKMTDACEAGLQRAKTVDAEAVKTILAEVQQGMDLIWSLRTIIIQEASEKSFWQNSDQKNEFNELLKALQGGQVDVAQAA